MTVIDMPHPKVRLRTLARFERYPVTDADRSYVAKHRLSTVFPDPNKIVPVGRAHFPIVKDTYGNLVKVRPNRSLDDILETQIGHAPFEHWIVPSYGAQFFGFLNAYHAGAWLISLAAMIIAYVEATLPGKEMAWPEMWCIVSAFVLLSPDLFSRFLPAFIFLRKE